MTEGFQKNIFFELMQFLLPAVHWKKLRSTKTSHVDANQTKKKLNNNNYNDYQKVVFLKPNFINKKIQNSNKNFEKNY